MWERSGKLTVVMFGLINLLFVNYDPENISLELRNRILIPIPLLPLADLCRSGMWGEGHRKVMRAWKLSSELSKG